MEKELRNSLVKIIGDTKIGVGFFVSPSHIFTATHILKENNNWKVFANGTNKDFDTEIEVDIVNSFDMKMGDITLLRLKNEISDETKSLNLLTAKHSLNNEFLCFGFPVSNKVNGSLSRGKIGEINQSDENVNQIELFDCPKLSAGYSGSPVYDTKLNGVIGLILSVANTDMFDSKIGFGFAVTSDFISEKFPKFHIDTLSFIQKSQKIREDLNVGDKIWGEVIEKVDYGYFIGYKAIDGLLHNKRIMNVDFSIGDKIEVLVYSKRKIDNRILIEFSLPKNKKNTTPKIALLNIESQIILNNSKTKKTILNLSNIGLKNLSSEIKYCSHITELNLSNNNLNILPPEIIFLTKLEKLILRDNKFGRIPDLLLSLPNLKQLDLTNNYIETIKSKFFEIELTTLNLEGNPISNKIKLFNLKNFQDIKEFHIEKKLNLTNEIPITSFKIGQELNVNPKLFYGWGAVVTISNELGFRDVILHKNEFEDRNILKQLRKLNFKTKVCSVIIKEIKDNKIFVKPNINFNDCLK